MRCGGRSTPCRRVSATHLGASGGDVFNYWSMHRGDSQCRAAIRPQKIISRRSWSPTPTMSIASSSTAAELHPLGIGDIAGSMTSYTKTARFDKNFTDVRLMMSNYGGYRTTADLNRAVTKNFVLRVNALASREKGWKDGDRHKKNAVDSPHAQARPRHASALRG